MCSLVFGNHVCKNLSPRCTTHSTFDLTDISVHPSKEHTHDTRWHGHADCVCYASDPATTANMRAEWKQTP
jgi:hypothetical protein